MERFGYGKFIMNKISDIQYGQVFHNGIIAEAVANEYKISVNKATPVTNVTLKRLVDKGFIERFQKGVYYRVKQTVFGRILPSVDVLETQLLLRRGNDIIGYETGASLLNQMGLTTLVSKKREIATNAYRKNLESKFIKAKKPITTVNTKNFHYLQLLDAIRDLPGAPINVDNPKAVLGAFIKNNKIDTVEALKYARNYYSEKTLLNLVDILVEG